MTTELESNQEQTTIDQTSDAPEGTSRRSFLGKGLALGAGAVGVGLLSNGVPAFAQKSTGNGIRKHAVPSLSEKDSGSLTSGDVAILRFLAALELIEADLWQQYNELGGIVDSEVPGGTVISSYATALSQLDGDMSQYIHDNTEDEISHFTFLNAYLASKGADPVNLDRFRTLASSKVTGAQQIGRLTNLMQLTVDTSWWTRYRSRTQNPDLGGTFPQAVPGLANGKFPAIPRNNNDLAGSTDTSPSTHLQAIANTAGFHFAYIEQGGNSLYPTLAQGVTNLEVLRILLSIGPTETMHFQTWHDKAGNAVPLTDPTNGLVFPNLNESPFGGEDFQTNLIMPEPTVFLRPSLPKVSIIRPRLMAGSGGAVATVKSFNADGLFIGQRPEFLAFLTQLGLAADAARRQA
jgi:hypothetical protein